MLIYLLPKENPCLKKYNQEFMNKLAEQVEKYFPKHKCKERGGALVLNAMANIYFRNILKRAIKETLEIERRRY